jgi:hypothetical protein
MGHDTFRGDFRSLFLDALRTSLEIPTFSEDFVAQFNAEVDRLCAKGAPQGIAARHVESSAVFAASYAALRSAGNADPLQALSKVIEGYGADITAYTREALQQGDDAFTRIVQMSKARELDYFGGDFGFERPRDDDNAYHLLITRCAYARLFATWGLPELTGLFCRLDEAWIRAIAPATHGVTFSRPTTIGWGGKRCEFLFDRTRPK